MNQQASLFGFELKESQEPKERLDIITTVLHYEASELVEFKKLCKKLMPQYFEDLQEANVNDLLLLLLKEKCDEKDSSQKDDDGRGSSQPPSKVRRRNHVHHRNRGRLRRLRRLRKLVVQV